MQNLIFSLNATIPVFLLMILGYILKLLKVVDEPFVKSLNAFNYKITLPVLLFRDIAESNLFIHWDFVYVLYCFFITLTCILLVAIFASIFYKGNFTGEFIQASYRGSAAVLGIAFIQNIYGNTGMAPLMIIGTVPLYNIAAVLLLSFSGPFGRHINKKSLLTSIFQILTNPIILGILIGMLVSLSKIRFPIIMEKSIDSVASLATPLALIGLGAGFEGRKALKQMKPTFICAFIKLLLQPLLFLPLAAWLSFRNEKMVSILIMLGAPTTVSCYIMAKNMGHEGTLTSSVVVTTTFLSSVTITFWLFVLRTMGFI